jgi:Ca-activated chloride channel family protein
MSSFLFTSFQDEEKSPFEKLFKIFTQLLSHTSGDVEEALDWMEELDKEYNLTTPEYTMDDFINDLKKKGYLREEVEGTGGFAITSKMEQKMRESALERIFGKLKKTNKGNHTTKHKGQGDELSDEIRPFQFGDTPEQISFLESFKNAQVNHGLQSFSMSENDLQVHEREHMAQTSTVLMIDISHSMILYGEDRITPAKNVAMALAEMIRKKYKKDTLDIIVFGDDAWQIELKDLPYLRVGPYHTNTVAGLELAMDILRKKRNSNKQIFMITDGKPSCLKEKGGYYKNSNGLDRKIVSRCLTLAASCRRLKIPITTFMVANDPYLQNFIDEFTNANQGKAFYSGLNGLGDAIFEDYEKNRRRKI